MFFYAAKIFWFFVQPLNLVVFLLLAGLLAWLLRRRRLAATALVSGTLVLLVCAWSSLGALMLIPLEERFRRPHALPDRIDGIVVLGGGFEGAINLARGGYEMNKGGDRFVETAILALRHPEAKVLISGGTGSILLDGEGDAETAVRFLTAFGIARDRLIVENRSRNTAENAVYSKEMADPQPGQTWLLVTSAFHMPRSVGLFRQVGFAVIPWPTDYRTSGREGLGLFEDNPQDALHSMSTALREWIGLAGYRLTGRIDEFFPGPQ